MFGIVPFWNNCAFGGLSVGQIEHYNALIHSYMNQLTLQKLICSILSLKNTKHNAKHLSYLRVIMLLIFYEQINAYVYLYSFSCFSDMIAIFVKFYFLFLLFKLPQKNISFGQWKFECQFKAFGNIGLKYMWALKLVYNLTTDIQILFNY